MLELAHPANATGGNSPVRVVTTVSNVEIVMSRVAQAVVVVGLFAVGCTSNANLATDDDLAPTTTAAASTSTSTTRPALLSTDGEVAPTTNPRAQPTSYRPATTTTTTTTTTMPTTTTIRPVNNRDDLLVDSVFDPILDELIVRSGVPIRLPADITDGRDGTVTDLTDERLVATLVSADAEGYEIVIGLSPNCLGQNVCRVASFNAWPTSSTVTEDADAAPNPIDGLLAVPLPQGITGHFVDPFCELDCSDGYVEWVEDDTTYSVGEKLASGPEALIWAWSSIDPTVPPPRVPESCGSVSTADSGRVAAMLTIEHGIHLLALCSADGILHELIEAHGSLYWSDLDGDTNNDLVLTRDDGTSRVFLVTGIVATPVTEPTGDVVTRMTIAPSQCVDLGRLARP